MLNVQLAFLIIVIEFCGPLNGIFKSMDIPYIRCLSCTGKNCTKEDKQVKNLKCLTKECFVLSRVKGVVEMGCRTENMFSDSYCMQTLSNNSKNTGLYCYTCNEDMCNHREHWEPTFYFKGVEASRMKCYKCDNIFCRQHIYDEEHCPTNVKHCYTIINEDQISKGCRQVTKDFEDSCRNASVKREICKFCDIDFCNSGEWYSSFSLWWVLVLVITLFFSAIPVW